MDCRRWEGLLDAMLKGALPPDSRREAEEHLARCPRCSELFATALASSAMPEEGEAEALTADILSLTSGSPCAASQERLPELVDGVLPAEESRLLGAHLEHCEDCRELAALLAWSAPVLPSLAELELDARFTDEVLAALAAERLAESEAPNEARAPNRLQAWWQGVWRRPLFPLEAAYLAILLLVALMGTPYSPLKSAPPRLLALIQGAPASLAAPMPMDLRPWTGPVFDRGEVFWSQGRAQVTETKRSFFADLASRRQRVGPFVSELWQHLRELLRSLREADFSAALVRVSNICGDCQRIREAWRGELAPTDDESPPRDLQAIDRE